ncbi:subclass B1 metallo-beta-lactamase [Algoriphagus confluentis]|uniref:beta-lactamase n=1 Tax=Algoriphagus confluentis TaxID=1697556 RepID=A0ABQ6PQR7_9BACT|nr:BcII family subclass B1 metallo-beta-lactamase [Algoriphagus confluentis]
MTKRFLFGLFLLKWISLPLVAQQDSLVYQSETLQIRQVSPSVFVHVSYLETQDFGKVGCNGMVVIDHGEALVFDTPTSDQVSEELIGWLVEKKIEVNGVLATHFHDDCLGGLDAFHVRGIPSFASDRTIDLAQKAGESVPQNGFGDELSQRVGDLEVVSRFFGEGHTRDNVVSFVLSDRVLFGGCLIKALGASEGFLGDANVGTWSETVSRVKVGFPEIKLVIPGHGEAGGKDLLEYTIQLFGTK